MTKKEKEDPTFLKINRILDSTHPLSREDVVFMLGFVAKKVAEKDPKLMSLSQPRLMENFLAYAEISMTLIQRRNHHDQEIDRLRFLLKEAAHGLLSN